MTHGAPLVRDRDAVVIDWDSSLGSFVELLTIASLEHADDSVTKGYQSPEVAITKAAQQAYSAEQCKWHRCSTARYP